MEGGVIFSEAWLKNCAIVWQKAYVFILYEWGIFILYTFCIHICDTAQKEVGGKSKPC